MVHMGQAMLKVLILIPLLMTQPNGLPMDTAPHPLIVIAETRVELPYDSEDVDILANIIWHEARGIEADVELACVAWTVCNRVDAGCGTLREVMTAPHQFAYVPDAELDAGDPVYIRCREIAADVLRRWSREQSGETDVGRTLPPEYLWYSGDGRHNYFRDAYTGGNVWDYSLPDVYGEAATEPDAGQEEAG